MPSESDCTAFITSVFNFERQAQAAHAQMAAVIQVRRVVKCTENVFIVALAHPAQNHGTKCRSS